MSEINNAADVIDSRDVIERIEELQDERQALADELEEAEADDDRHQHREQRELRSCRGPHDGPGLRRRRLPGYPHRVAPGGLGRLEPAQVRLAPAELWGLALALPDLGRRAWCYRRLGTPAGDPDRITPLRLPSLAYSRTQSLLTSQG